MHIQVTLWEMGQSGGPMGFSSHVNSKAILDWQLFL